MSTRRIVFILTATSTGLIAGLMYAYQSSINPGLARLSDREYISAMQSINRAILNPMFFASFMGTLILLPVSTWMNYTRPMTRTFKLLLSAAVIYIVGVFGVTMFGNVPLNEAFDKFNLDLASAEEIVKHRTDFATAWNTYHAVRTLASIISFVLVILACLSYGNAIEEKKGVKLS